MQGPFPRAPRAEASPASPTPIGSANMVAKTVDREERAAGARDVELEVRVATSIDAVLAAWQLVHDCHVAQGLIRENAFALHTNAHAASPGATVLCGTLGGQIVSTLTVTRDGARGLALDATYARELDRIRSSGQRLSELGLLAHRSAGNGLEQLLAISLDYGLRDAYSGVVMAVNPHHVGFYSRVFGFEVRGPERRLPWCASRVLLMHLDRSVFDRSPVPRGLALLRDRPVKAGFYAGAFGFMPSQLAGTPLARYLAARSVRPPRLTPSVSS